MITTSTRVEDADIASAFRITKVICPSCGGTGVCDLFRGLPGGDVRCNWCKGAKRLPVAEAINYAEFVYTIAVGGYVAGDHDKADADRMTDKAERVYALCQQVPSWKSASPVRSLSQGAGHEQ